LLRLEGVWVRGVAFEPDGVVVRVALRRRRLVCAHCAFSTRVRENTQAHESVWRHLDLGVWRLEVRATLRRLDCPVHGVHVEGVPFAREGARFTADFEDLVAWLATKTDRTAACRLARVDWKSVGRIIERVAFEQLDPGRLGDLYDIGIDEVSWRKQHSYLTLVVDHRRGCVVWGTAGAGAAAADRFFAELDPPEPGNPIDPQPSVQLAIPGAGADRADPERVIGERASKLQAISMDMGPGYALSAREHAPNAVICIDPFHVVALTTRALDEVRRGYWNELRSLDDKDAAKRFKDARWVLLKNPERLTEKQAVTHRKLREAGGDVWHAYTLKEALRSIFADELTIADVEILLDEFIASAAQSALKPFVRLAETIRRHRDGILAAVRLGVNNARVEAINNKVRLITRRAYGFHSAKAALALVHLTCGPIDLELPHEHA
jgi:transposase